MGGSWSISKSHNPGPGFVLKAGSSSMLGQQELGWNPDPGRQGAPGPHLCHHERACWDGKSRWGEPVARPFSGILVPGPMDSLSPSSFFPPTKQVPSHCSRLYLFPDFIRFQQTLSYCCAPEVSTLIRGVGRTNPTWPFMGPCPVGPRRPQEVWVPE